MKTKTILFYGAAAAALAYFFVLRKKTTSAPPPEDPPVDTQGAIEPPVLDPARRDTELALSNLLNGKGGGQRGGNSGSAPNRISGYTQVFQNRVYTKVKDFYGPNANTGLYPESKRLGLYQRIWNNLSAKGVSNPNNATLGQIGPALRDIGAEGFNYQHK